MDQTDNIIEIFDKIYALKENKIFEIVKLFTNEINDAYLRQLLIHSYIF